jgi:hypothetical protein
MTNFKKIIHHFWLDHLEIFWTFKNENIFNKLDFDNSNYSELDEYKITKNEVPKYKYKIIFNKNNYSYFAYYKWLPKSKKQPIATRDYIVIYSTAFKLLEYEEVLWFIEYYLNLKHCRRFDICIDLKINIDELLKNYFKKYKTGRDYRKWNKTETRYFWELKNSLNKRQLIRVYNKNLDILEKKKIDLYQDYLTFNNITRIELEIRPELAKVRNYKEVFDDVLLIGIFKNYLYKYTKIFEQIEWEKITLYKSKNKILSSEDYQGIFYKTWRLKNFIWSSRTIYNLWFCPVRILIWEWYIKDKTKIALWIDKIEDLINKEREVKIRTRENYYIRNNINEILSNLYKYGKI